jgi:hypothetical protein
MRQITVETNVQQALDALADQVAVCDVNGRVIGFFLPLRERPRIEDLRREPLLSIAETEALRQQNRTGKPLEDILGRLGL